MRTRIVEAHVFLLRGIMLEMHPKLKPIEQARDMRIDILRIFADYPF